MRARHHVDEVNIVPDLGHGRTLDNAVHGIGDIFRGDAELPGLVLDDIDLHHARRLVPVHHEVREQLMFTDDTGQLLTEFADLLDIRTAQAILDRFPDGRTDIEQFHEGVGADECPVQIILQLGTHLVAHIQPLGDDDRLAEGDVRCLHVEGQDETRCAFADIGRPMVDIRIFRQHFLLELRHLPVGFGNRAVLRQVPVDDQLHTVG
ncbi:hypothetical protein D3C86_1546750 [compost metagenome]